MQKIDSRVTSEINSLVEVGRRLHRSASLSPRAIGGDELAEITTWVTRVGQLVRNLYGEESQHFVSYSRAVETESFYNLHSNYYAQLSQVLGVAQAMKHDVSNGLLVNVKSLVQAEVFSDFLEMGEHLLHEGYKDAAAVIIGSVLEDNLRKLSERNSLPVKSNSGKSLTIDPLNIQLAKANVYSKLVQKQITTWAHVRNKSAHGEYTEYSSDEVKMMLLFVQSFSAENFT